jgi:hypothetical protein
MNAIPYERIQDYRRDTFRLAPERRLKSQEQAIEFVNQRGFIFFWPINGILLPSLWSAVAGDRPVADEHDDPGHVTWGWKDALLGSRAWYYAKLLRRRATMLSFEVAPYFYALTENYGSPEEDYLTLYEQGRLTQEAKTLYEALLDQGPLDTIALRRATHMTSKASNSRFERALADLQADMKILPVGVTQAGSWHYAFAYDLTPRQYPELPEQAQFIQENLARRKLVELYFRSVGAGRLRDVCYLFGWKAPLAQNVLDQLSQQGILRGELALENQPGQYYVLTCLT